MRQGRGRLKIFLNLKCIFALFVLFYLHDLHKTLIFTIHSVVFNHIIFRGDNPQTGGVLSPPTPLGFLPMCKAMYMETTYISGVL